MIPKSDAWTRSTAAEAERAMRVAPSGPEMSGEPRASEALPFVSIIMPVKNEAEHIASNLSAVLDQQYPTDRFEVLVADGRSTDGTREIVQSFAASHPSIRLVDNPRGIVSAGLNRALAVAHGDIIVRLDGHCEYPRDYVRRVVTLREQSGATNLGGVLVPVGTSYVQRAICAAYSSAVGVGGAALRASPDTDSVRDVDAVHGGCWRREALVAVGAFSEEMVRNQDDELSFRIRKGGGRIVQSTGIRVRYVVRDRWGKLFQQFAQYGYWKQRLVRKYPRQASIRHFLPALLVALPIVGLALGVLWGWASIAALAIVALYLAAILVAALFAAVRSSIALLPGIAFAFFLMHVGYGCGFLAGLLGSLGGRFRADAVFSRLTR